MEYIGFFINLRGRLKLLLVLFLSVLLGSVKSQVSNKAFKLRYRADQKGDIYYVSNSVIGCGSCRGQAENPPGGVANNNDYNGEFIDVDSSDETFNSSSADLELPDCSSITFAGLYWKASLSTSNSRYQERSSIKLKLPSSPSYIDLVADEDIKGQFFKDVTKIISSSNHVSGTYTAANIVADKGEKNLYGGWTLIVVVKQEVMALRSLAVFDGLAYVKANSNESFTINGLFTPPSGPVSLDFGFVVYDGDRGVQGDNLRFNNVKVYDNLHSPLNTFNSSITYKGTIVKTRNPSYSNTLGFDASVMKLDNVNYQYLQNGQSSAVINLKTEGEEYFFGVLTSSIDLYSPSYRLCHSYRNFRDSNSEIKLKDSIDVTFSIKNVGNDIGKTALFIDTIPKEFTYNKSSLQIQYGNGSWQHLSDLIDDDGCGYEAEKDRLVVRLGAMPSDAEVKIKYHLTLKDDPLIVKCANGMISHNGWLEYFDAITSQVKRIASESSLGTYCHQGEPMIFNLEFPSLPGDISANTYCSTISTSELNLPLGYVLYRADDDSFRYSLDRVQESGIYKAYRKTSSGCEHSFNVTVNVRHPVITVQPQLVNVMTGSNALFAAVIDGESLSYQWQVDRCNGVWVDLTGSVSNTLTLSPVTSSMNNNRYRLMISSPCGDVLFSEAANLSVKQPESVPSSAPGNTSPPFGSLYVPNAFMPASRTTELRNFMVKGMGLSKWEMKIMNKWDQVIWQTDRLDANGTPVEGWDGKMDGVDAPQGAYMWVISAVFPDGSEWKGMCLRSGRPRKSGIVYLIR